MGKNNFKKFKINISPREHIEPEEIFFDSEKIRQFEEDAVEVEMLERPISPLVFLSFDILQIGIILFIAIFTAFIIVGKGGEYAVQAQDNSSRASFVFAERGVIYSSDGVVLAGNETYFDIFIKSVELQNQNMKAKEFLEIANTISSAVNKNSQDIYKRFLEAETKNFSEYVILRGVSSEEIKKISDITKNYSFFEVREASRRRYAENPSLSHVVGYTGEITSSDLLFGEYSRGERVGKVGVEVFYDDILGGEQGIIIRKMDSRGNVLKQELSKKPSKGESVTLYINAQLQDEVYAILSRHAKALGVDAAVAIVMDVKSGGIVSLVNIPGFDANLFEHGISENDFKEIVNNSQKPLFNRAISGEYPSGSIIKPIIALAALEEDLVSPDFLVYSSGAIEVPSVYNSDVTYIFKDWKAHGWADMRKAIADSVNIYFYTIGGGYEGQEGLGIKNIEKYLKKFNWGKKLGIDLPGEREGFIPTPKWKKEQKGENWYIGDTYITSIGQGAILVTPLQIAASTVVFANGGTLLTPQIVSKIGDDVIKPIIIDDNFISADNIEVIREGMRQSVESGSSRFLADLPYEVAGKTGTAQTGRARNHAWFTGFAPYNDPSIVVTVLLEEGEKSDYAVRVAKEILQAYFKIYPQK